jgi:hypothetical protein
MYSGFLHQQNWLPQYNWNIVESGIKHHNPNLLVHLFLKLIQIIVFFDNVDILHI